MSCFLVKDGGVKMPCTPFRSADGKTTGFVCTRTRMKTCSVCGKRPEEKLCDFPVLGKRKSKTCDKGLCGVCATEIDPRRLPQQFIEHVQKHDTFDVCPVHMRFIEKNEVKNGI